MLSKVVIRAVYFMTLKTQNMTLFFAKYNLIPILSKLLIKNILVTPKIFISLNWWSTIQFHVTRNVFVTKIAIFRKKTF